MVDCVLDGLIMDDCKSDSNGRAPRLTPLHWQFSVFSSLADHFVDVNKGYCYASNPLFDVAIRGVPSVAAMYAAILFRLPL